MWDGLRDRMQALVFHRADRPWLALVVVPLVAVLAIDVVRLWLLVPLGILMWWWGGGGSKEMNWVWILGVLEVAWGTQWTVLLITLIAMNPRHLVAVVTGMVVYGLLVAAVGAVNRWRYHRQYGL